MKSKELLLVDHNGHKEFSQFLHKMKSKELLLVDPNGHKEFSQFLHKMKSNNEQLLLVAHNGHTFDQNRFPNFIHEASASEYLNKTIFNEIVPNSRQLSFIKPGFHYKANATTTTQIESWAAILHANRFVLIRNWSLSWS